MKNLKNKTVFCLFILLSACAETEIPSYTTSSLYVFGDSLSDVGNAQIASSGLFPDKNYYAGRFSNGPNYADQLANQLITPLSPSRSYGSNYAFGGSRSIEMNAQVSNYKQNVENIADPDALYIIWSGGNDLLEILFNAATTNSVDAAIAHIAAAIRKLSLMGATRILIPNQINLAYIPQIINIENTLPGTQASATALTQQFNTALSTMLDKLSSAENITTIKFDAWSLFDNVINDPENYNLANVTDRCYIKDVTNIELTGDETICENSATYLFWDDLHPSNAGHTIISNALFLTLTKP